MALKLDGRDDNITRAMLIAFAGRFGVKEAAMRSMLDEIVESSVSWIGRVREIGLGEKKTAHLQKLMSKRREDLG